MKDLGEHIIEEWVAGMRPHPGIFYEKKDGLYKESCGRLEKRFNANGPDYRAVSINRKIYFEIYPLSKKPPLGVMGQKVHDEIREGELGAAIIRYVEAEKEVPMEWVDEYNEIIKRWAE